MHVQKFPQAVNKTDWFLPAGSLMLPYSKTSLEVKIKTKLNARLVIRQRADLFEVIVFPFSVALARRKFNFVSRNIGLE